VGVVTTSTRLLSTLNEAPQLAQKVASAGDFFPHFEQYFSAN
jgi:hypothetical protein